jgi:hypothetical protein
MLTTILVAVVAFAAGAVARPYLPGLFEWAFKKITGSH